MTRYSLPFLAVLLAAPLRAEVKIEGDLRDAVSMQRPAPALQRPPLSGPADSYRARPSGAAPSTCAKLGWLSSAAKRSRGAGRTRIGREEFEAFARLARYACETTGEEPADPEAPAIRAWGPYGVAASAEVRQVFEYEPRSWLVVHRLTVSQDGARELEFWPADPRDLPGSPAHEPYLKLSATLPSQGPRAVSFRISADGSIEPLVWTVTAAGGEHAPLQRADVQEWLKDELGFWARTAAKLAR